VFFYEINKKLDFLMKVTNTTNSALAAATSLDASYISRLRRGVRSLPKNENYVHLMADYFAKYYVEDFQTKALQECIPHSYTISNDQRENGRSIMRWLREDDDHPSKNVQGLLDILEDFQFKKPQSWSKLRVLIILKQKELWYLSILDSPASRKQHWHFCCQ